MIFGLFSKRNANRAILERQYATLTAAARDPGFYEQLNVPDTVMGRFEMISLVMILFLRRTRNASQRAQEIAQGLVDAFFEDVDYSIRELGVGDSSVPKRMKKLAGMFYGRLEAYVKDLDSGDTEALAASLQRNIHPEREDAPDMRQLASWMVRAEAALGAQSDEVVATGSLALPGAMQGV